MSNNGFSIIALYNRVERWKRKYRKTLFLKNAWKRKYLELKEPWKTLKENSENRNGLNTLSISCEGIALSAKLLYPVMPKKCEEIFDILGIDKKSINNLDFETISENSIKPHKALFPRIENDD